MFNIINISKLNKNIKKISTKSTQKIFLTNFPKFVKTGKMVLYFYMSDKTQF